MSGFITIYNTDGEPVDRSLLHSLTQTLKFRGPDQQKIWVDDNIGMGHALFKTTFEAEYENQPATIDNKVWITCSARIDDRKNLVNKLGMKKEINLNKTPDSELILHAYRKWDENCLDHLLGDFAFVIWDKEKEKLFCAKDPFGKRQLYYAYNKKVIVLSNNLQTILSHPTISRKLSDKAIAGFLLHGDHTSMDKSITVFDDINALPPAHKLILRNNKLEIKQYWTIPLGKKSLVYKNKHEYVEHFLDTFQTAIKDRIRTNSVVVSMSGGMDSSSIAAILTRIKQNTLTDLNIQAVTATYDRLIPCKERHYASLVAQHLHLPIHYMPGDEYPFLLSNNMTIRPLQLFTPNYPQDFSKQIASLSRVVLTGDAADNLFAPSPFLLAFKENNPIKTLSDMIYLYKEYGKFSGLGLKKMLKEIMGHNKSSNNPNYPSWLDTEFENKLQLKKYWENQLSPYEGKINQRHPTTSIALQRFDWNTESSILNPNFTSPEMRDPYLDIRLVSFVFSLPLLPWFFNKHLLRSSMDGYLPEPILKRPKTYLNHMLPALLEEPKNKWVYQWEPTQELAKYIQLQKVMPNANLFDKQQNSFVNMRPIILDIWLQQLKKLSF